MAQLLEYVTRHPFLAGGTLLLALATLAYEISRARSGGQSVGPTDAVRLINQGAVLLDLRSQAEFDAGHIVDARHVPLDQLATSIEALRKFKEKVVITCCESGIRSRTGLRQLQAQGFTRVVNLKGGLQAWRTENLPLVKAGDRNR